MPVFAISTKLIFTNKNKSIYQFWLFFDNILSASVGMISQNSPLKNTTKNTKESIETSKTEHGVV